MKLIDIIKKRQSVRKYSDKSVEKEKIEKCIEAALLAPSACNAQPWKYIVVDEAKIKNQVAEACFSKVMSFNKFAVEAPVLVVVVMESVNFKSKFGQVVKNIDYPLMDIGISVDHFCLQATELGVDSCMLGWFNEKKIQKILEIPKKKHVYLVISLGYAPDDYKQREKIRKSTEMTVSYNKY
jgi:nitroreductase